MTAREDGLKLSAVVSLSVCLSFTIWQATHIARVRKSSFSLMGVSRKFKVRMSDRIESGSNENRPMTSSGFIEIR
jgi:hypothetical protein